VSQDSQQEAGGRATYLVEEGQGSVLVGEVTDLLDRSDGTAHRVDGLEGDDLGRLLGVSGELPLEVSHVVVLKDLLLRARVPDTLNHGGMVGRIGEVDAAGKLRAKSSEGGVVGDVARGEDESSFFAVEGGELVLEGKVDRGVSGDVSGTSSSGSVLGESTPSRQIEGGESATSRTEVEEDEKKQLTSSSRRQRRSCSCPGSRSNTRHRPRPSGWRCGRQETFWPVG
jgi:hypothetical protein